MIYKSLPIIYYSFYIARKNQVWFASQTDSEIRDQTKIWDFKPPPDQYKSLSDPVQKTISAWPNKPQVPLPCRDHVAHMMRYKYIHVSLYFTCEMHTHLLPEEVTYVYTALYICMYEYDR